MNLTRLHLRLLTCLTILFSQTVSAQLVPVGQWQSYYSYNSARSVELVKDKIFVGKSNLYSYSLTENDYTIYSKVNGLNDVNINLIRYDETSDIMIIIYENGNIDLYQHQSFINIPDIKNLNITGSKRINSVYFKSNLIYLCTDFGIVVLNPIKREIKESYVLQASTEILQVKALATKEGYFYAATSKGIYKASETDNTLQNFASWSAITDTPTLAICNHLGKLICASSTHLYELTGTGLVSLYESQAPIEGVRQGLTDLYVRERSDDRRAVMIFNQNGLLADSVKNLNSNDIVETKPNEFWDADEWEGLIKVTDRINKSLYNPNGVYSASLYKLSEGNGEIFVSGGGESGWNPSFNSSGISRYSNGSWDWFNRYVGTPGMDSVIDIMDVAVDTRNNYIYAGSFGGGLLEIHPDKTTSTYKENGFIQSQIGNPGANIIPSLAFDSKHNLWMSNYSAPSQMVVKKADGSWQKFSFPYTSGEKSAGQIVIDDADQKWMLAPRGNGVFVLNDNGTIDNKSDDKIRLLTTGVGNGNLSNNDVYSISKDKNGKIWIGTSDGIVIFNCPESVTTSSGCDGELKIVKYDLNAGLLFQRENVNTIAVDGANNKWIGTNNGVWLISDDAEKIIHRFTKDNSPLPSNEVKSIVIHPTTGEVFIATNDGLVSYRSEAIEGKETNESLLVFPNPVPSNYQGYITIKDLVTNADVRITDAAGQLVYRTIAQGGQAVWNGKNYLGERPRTGVYFVFVTNADGSETKVGKFVYNE